MRPIGHVRPHILPVHFRPIQNGHWSGMGRWANNLCWANQFSPMFVAPSIFTQGIHPLNGPMTSAKFGQFCVGPAAAVENATDCSVFRVRNTNNFRDSSRDAHFLYCTGCCQNCEKYNTMLVKVYDYDKPLDSKYL